MNARHLSGVTAELFAAYRLSSVGYRIYYPFLTQSKCDLLIEDPLGNYYKVQVKKATKSSANGYQFIQVRLGGCGRSNYIEGDFDYLAMVYEDRLWLFPWSYTKDKTSMSFSIFGEDVSKKGRRDISPYEIKGGL